MKLAPSSLGAEPKKIALLGGLVVLLVVVLWMENRSDSPAVSATVNPPSSPVAATPPVPQRAPQGPSVSNTPEAPATASTSPQPAPSSPGTRLGTDAGTDNFVPTLKKNDDVDLSKIDPRIHLELLAKVRAVPLEGGASSLFDFSKPPEAALPKVEPIKPAPPPVPVPPPQVKPAAAKQTTPPPPPPVPFKYYGYVGQAADGHLEGLFVEGDPVSGNIYAKREGDVIKDRYKIVRINLRSVEVEDLVAKSQQTLKILDEQQ